MTQVLESPAANPPAEPPPDRPRFQIGDLCVYLESYLSADQIREVYRAFQFGAEAHAGQTRKSGEPYIQHPIAVARILAEMRMDHKCLMAAILHDVIEDTGHSKETVAALFDEEIAELVDGVSKLTRLDFRSKAEAQAANLQKMLLAMTKDIRVILIKLADRLHNMRTLGIMAPEKRRRISRETLEIYAPIANRLGIRKISLELEELGFAHCWPWRRLLLQRAVVRARGARKELVADVERALRERLEQEGIQGEVVGRQKHLYGIYGKMRDKQRPFDEVVDVFGFRVVVDRIDTCYRVLGVVHNLYKPMPGRFKDYIAIPKNNGYQSLHTQLFGPQGIPIEIQIRTLDMQRHAESGIAAHWMYKSGAKRPSPQNLAADWLGNLLEMQRGSGDSVEFLEHVKVDLFPDEVYVFTPRGDIQVLPAGATVVDFAYAIHSGLGNRCVAARIDRRMAPLRTALRSGQTVEIITAPRAMPNAGWLNFVVTGKARANIRGYLQESAAPGGRGPGPAPAERRAGGAGAGPGPAAGGPPGGLSGAGQAAGFGYPAGGGGAGQSVADPGGATPHGRGSGRGAPRRRAQTGAPSGHQGHRGHGGHLWALLPAHSGGPHLRTLQPWQGHRGPPAGMSKPR